MSNPKPRVIIVEDEPELLATYASFLNLSGFVAYGFRQGAEFDAWIEDNSCDLAVLDLGLPDCDGLAIARKLKEKGRCGIVIVTARGQIDDRLRGYTVGADHYMVKPVDLRELVAVLTAIHGRLPPAETAWTLDTVEWQLTAPNGVPVRLTKSELAILKCLAQSPGDAVPRSALVEALGYQDDSYDPRRMEILIRRLRTKIRETTDFLPPIETAHRLGYAFAADIRVL